MTKRVYFESVKKWVLANKLKTTAGVISSPLIIWLFSFLIASGVMNVSGVSGDVVCAGGGTHENPEDPCYTYLNFTVNEDVFVYPFDYDPYGRNTPLSFDVPLKDWRLQRSWGNGWRTYDLQNPCTATWCGAPPNSPNNKYSLAWRVGKKYQIRIVGYKWNPSDEVHWSFNPDGRWLSASSKYNLTLNCVNETRAKWNKTSNEKIFFCGLANASCVGGEMKYNETNSTLVEYSVEVCTEIGVSIDKKVISYEQSDKACLRTNNTLCCWGLQDGGVNADKKTGEFRTSCKSGENQCKCVDLDNELAVLDEGIKTVYPEVKI